MTDYLLKINKHLGATVYQNVVNAVGGNIVVKKEMVLDELHIYGSSRHGIHKPNVTLVNKTYKLNNIDSASDSTQAHLSYKYFKRTLTYKQYELSNHLGNVLATVLDRKTFVGDDTLEYYKADVYTAGLYYAFGGGIEEMQYTSDTTNSYRYTFNGKEQDSETDLQDYGFRIYNPSIGKFLSVDPLADEYPWNSTYAFAENDVISCIDLEGAEKYFTPDGIFLGSLNENNPKLANQIYIVESKEVYDKHIDGSTLKAGESGPISMPFKTIYQVNDETKAKIFKTIYLREINNRNQTNITIIEVEDRGGDCPDKNNIRINKNLRKRINFIRNYYDVAGLLYHEELHRKLWAKGDNNGGKDFYEHEKVTAAIFTSTLWSKMSQSGRDYHLWVYHSEYIKGIQRSIMYLVNKYDKKEDLAKDPEYIAYIKTYDEFVLKYLNAGGKDKILPMDVDTLYEKKEKVKPVENTIVPKQ